MTGLWARLAMLFAGMALACSAVPAAAATSLRLNQSLCHSVSSIDLPDARLTSLDFACDGTPAGYQHASLWLRAEVGDMDIVSRDLALAVRQSRFDRLAVGFTYADGTTRWRSVRQGDYGSHWRAGGQILFEAPERSVPLAAVTLRFDRLAGHEFVRARLVTKGEAAIQSGGIAAAVGAALTLLLVSAIYSLSLAFAVRRQYLAWQAAWSATMILWGGIWSQAHLGVLPMTAGSVSAQTGTFLACLAIALATVSAVKAVDRAVAPLLLRRTALLLGCGIGLAGIPLALMRSGNLGLWADLLGLVIVAGLMTVAIYLGWAWRRGSVEARDFLAAWCLPMATLAFIHIVDVGDGPWGGGSQLPMLLAATWQALWLAAAATRRLAQLRVERDHARAGEAKARKLAQHDPLTGLPNRRGFVDSVTPLLERAREGDLPAALLLVDIDRFKSINDVHGHEAGDAVLCTIADRIKRWEGPMCTVARLGGEEFGLLTVGMDGIVLARFAESVRRGISACDYRSVVGERKVTASIGVAEVRPACDFQKLYRLADEALYDAKRGGRDRVAVLRQADSDRSAPDIAGCEAAASN